MNEKKWALERASYQMGTHGAAFEVRKIDVASVNVKTLLEQLAKEQERSDLRSARHRILDAHL